MLPYRERFVGLVNEVDGAIKEVEGKMAGLQDLMAEYKNQVLGSSGPGGEGFQQYPSFAYFPNRKRGVLASLPTVLTTQIT